MKLKYHDIFFFCKTQTFSFLLRKEQFFWFLFFGQLTHIYIYIYY